MSTKLIGTFDYPKEWKDYCYYTHSLYIKNQHFRKWISDKDISLFNFSNIKKDIKHIKLGIEDAIKTAKLHFKICYATDSKIKKMNITDEKISSSKLLKTVAEERKKSHKEHANIYIFNKPIKSSNAIIEDGEALTYVSEGVIIFTFDSFRKYLHKFLRRRAKHEALHLLGLNFHHDDIKVTGYSNDAACVMQYNAPTQYLCKKCKEALVYFWKGIEYETNGKFIKN